MLRPPHPRQLLNDESSEVRLAAAKVLLAAMDRLLELNWARAPQQSEAAPTESFDEVMARCRQILQERRATLPSSKPPFPPLRPTAKTATAELHHRRPASRIAPSWRPRGPDDDLQHRLPAVRLVAPSANSRRFDPIDLTKE